jgi:hypothetical protein
MRDRDQIILENLYGDLFEAYYDSRKEPRRKPSKFGYFDADQLLGKRVWVHTNRTNRDEKRNGMIGVYIPAVKGGKETRSNQRYGYTNEVRLNDTVFDVNMICVKTIQDSEKRSLCAGIIGNIIRTEGSLSGFEEFTFNPFDKDANGYYRKSDPLKETIMSAEEVYINATEDGKYIVMGRGIKTQPNFKNEDENENENEIR